MADDFQGSTAQNALNFSINTTIETVPGSNFYTPVMYIGSGTNADANIVDPPDIDDYITVNASNFGALLLGDLLDWFSVYFASSKNTNVLIVVYNSVTASYGGVAPAYQATKTLGYQKLIFEVGAAGAAQVALGKLCNEDSLLSQFWVGTSDAGSFASPATGVAADLLAASPPVEAVVIYSAQSGINPALAQLGMTLSVINSTGTPVGNRTGNIASSAVVSSGTTGGSDNSNNSATEQAHLEANLIGFFRTVGNGTGQVNLVGELTNKDNDSAAQWVEAFINYVCQVNGATYITQLNPPVFTNNDAYQAILAIIRAVITPFANFGRLSNVKITKLPFTSLPAHPGNELIIPNAWSATFVRGLQEVLVQGNITITIP